MSSRAALYIFGHGAICSPVARGHHIGWSAGSARRPDAAAHRQKPAGTERLHVLHRSRTVPWHGQIDLVEPFSGSTRSRLDPDIKKRCRTPQRRSRSRHQCAVSKIVEDDCGIFRVGETNARDGFSSREPITWACYRWVSRSLSSGALLRNPLAHAGYLLTLNVHAKGKSASDDQDGRGQYLARSIPHVTATGM